MTIVKIEVPEDKNGQRLDLFLSQSMSVSRNQVQRWIEEERVTLIGHCVKSKDKVKSGSILAIDIPSPVKSVISPENIPVEILFEDSWIVVVNKPKGMTVHPGAGRNSGTLVNALLYHIKDLSGIGGVERPGIVHRLDKDTSGSMVVAKNDRAHEHLVKLFEERKIKKEYIALVHGIPRNESDFIEAPISRHPVKRKKMTVSNYGREARTYWSVIERFSSYSLLKVRTYTGRTHQIRVHLTSIGHPLLGDELYGARSNPFEIKGHMLHSSLLGLFHPEDGRYLEFISPIPPELEKILKQLRKAE